MNKVIWTFASEQVDATESTPAHTRYRFFANNGDVTKLVADAVPLKLRTNEYGFNYVATTLSQEKFFAALRVRLGAPNLAFVASSQFDGSIMQKKVVSALNRTVLEGAETAERVKAVA